jgi:3-carboxy-cis,cis-muconate cycloisomerase
MMGLAPHMGRNEAHDVVSDACRAVADKGGSLADALAKVPAVTKHLDRKAIERLTDPSNYLGAAREMVDRVVGKR